GDVDALVHEVTDARQEIQIGVAVAPGGAAGARCGGRTAPAHQRTRPRGVTPSVRAGRSSPRRSYRLSVCGSIPLSSEATEMPYTPRADRARGSSGTDLLHFSTTKLFHIHPCTKLDPSAIRNL